MTQTAVVRWSSRTDSGLRAADPSRLSTRTARLVGVTVHWTGGNTGATVPDYKVRDQQVLADDELRRRRDSERRYWRMLQRAALSGANPNGTRYGDIEYNAGITDTGLILEGRANGVNGAHATSRNNIANETTLGVAYCGAGEPTRLAIAALRAYLYVSTLAIKPPSGRLVVVGHEDWRPFGGIPTACPGTLETLVRQLAHELGR